MTSNAYSFWKRFATQGLSDGDADSGDVRLTRLWRSVFAQARDDALWQDTKFGHPITKDGTDEKRRTRMAAGVRARAWFTDNGPDFVFVCDMADLDAQRVREHVMAEIAARQTESIEINS